MFGMKRLTGAAVAAGLMVGGHAVAADTPAMSAADAFDQMMAAQKVADFGRREKDPHALITAARMLQEIPVTDRGPAPAEGQAPAAFTPAGLYAEARALAQGDTALQMQITVAESSGGRGVASSIFGVGLVRIVQPVNPRGQVTFPIKAKTGEVLRIGAIGDANTRIAMRLRDAKGGVVCTDQGDYAPVCQVQPKGKATDYKVEIVNQSDTKTQAVILSN